MFNPSDHAMGATDAPPALDKVEAVRGSWSGGDNGIGEPSDLASVRGNGMGAGFLPRPSLKKTTSVSHLGRRRIFRPTPPPIVRLYTGARVGAVTKLAVRSFCDAGGQWAFRFDEKGGKSREIPCQHDLQQFVRAYVDAAGIADQKHGPLFRSAVRRERRLSLSAVPAKDVCRMAKRRLRDAGLPDRISPHSFRVAVATDLLTQDVPLEQVQYLLGHADSRTTKLYDRRKCQVTRNVVERISV
jgi:integrase